MYRIIQVFSLSEGRGTQRCGVFINFFEIHLNDKRSNDSPPRERNQVRDASVTPLIRKVTLPASALHASKRGYVDSHETLHLERQPLGMAR
ncbi:hypothetical protein CEXT_216011 [Caerostris extrusa]|uniref:Uncharacterized protein n=1 Tax=Caerostris extrusa TaxID=172846 RepID=A0AAV4SRV8_CAEEX|nr:hypothetical protein CEXT_216011 [Caerostris extrusa]